MKKSIAADIITAILILVFSYTAFSKLISIDRFSDVLWQAPLIGQGADFVAWTVPLTELIIVLLLFLPPTRRTGLYASLLMLSVFTGYLLYMLFSGTDLPCQCGGVISAMSWRQHVVFNGALIAGIIWSLVKGFRS